MDRGTDVSMKQSRIRCHRSYKASAGRNVPGNWGRQRNPVASGIAVALLAMTLSCCTNRGADRSPTAAMGKRPNVVLITVDTLRADHLGSYGYPMPTTPSIDYLSARGVRFTQSMATTSETAPSVASLLTGLYQHHHRVLFNRAALPQSVTTIAEYLSAAGYTTAGFVGNLLLDEEYGFAQGFAQFKSFVPDPVWAASDNRGVEMAIRWLRAEPSRPWFLWIHLMDPHGPYTSAKPWWSDEFDYPRGMFGEDRPVPLGKGNFGLDVIPRYQRIKGFKRLSEYVRRYDGEIRFTDAQIERLLGVLALLGYTDNTLVILTADHGESLTEHGEYLQHGWYLYEATLHVPLIFYWPGSVPAGTTVSALVSGVDLLPTLTEILGIDTSQEAFDGESFVDDLFGTGRPAKSPKFAVGARKNHPFCIRRDSWKLIHTPAGRPPTPNALFAGKGYTTSERIELYDLSADPSETENLVEVHPRRVDAMMAELRAFEQTVGKSGQRVTRRHPLPFKR